MTNSGSSQDATVQDAMGPDMWPTQPYVSNSTSAYDAQKVWWWVTTTLHWDKHPQYPQQPVDGLTTDQPSVFESLQKWFALVASACPIFYEQNAEYKLAMNRVESAEKDVTIAMDRVKSAMDRVESAMDRVKSAEKDVTIVMDRVKSAEKDVKSAEKDVTIAMYAQQSTSAAEANVEVANAAVEVANADVEVANAAVEVANAAVENAITECKTVLLAKFPEAMKSFTRLSPTTIEQFLVAQGTPFFDRPWYGDTTKHTLMERVSEEKVLEATWKEIRDAHTTSMETGKMPFCIICGESGTGKTVSQLAFPLNGRTIGVRMSVGSSCCMEMLTFAREFTGKAVAEFILEKFRKLPDYPDSVKFPGGNDGNAPLDNKRRIDLRLVVAFDELGGDLKLAKLVCNARCEICSCLQEVFDEVHVVGAGTGLELLSTAVGSTPQSVRVIKMSDSGLLNELLTAYPKTRECLRDDALLMTIMNNRRTAAGILHMLQQTRLFQGRYFEDFTPVASVGEATDARAALSNFLTIDGAWNYKITNGLDPCNFTQLCEMVRHACRAVFIPFDDYLDSDSNVAYSEQRSKCQTVLTKGLVSDTAKKILIPDDNTKHLDGSASKHKRCEPDDKFPDGNTKYAVVYDTTQSRTRFRMSMAQAGLQFLLYGNVLPAHANSGEGLELKVAMFFQLLLTALSGEDEVVSAKDIIPVLYPYVLTETVATMVEHLKGRSTPGTGAVPDPPLAVRSYKLDSRIGLTKVKGKNAFRSVLPPDEDEEEEVEVGKGVKGNYILLQPPPQSPFGDLISVIRNRLVKIIQDKDYSTSLSVADIIDELMKMGFKPVGGTFKMTDGSDVTVKVVDMPSGCTEITTDTKTVRHASSTLRLYMTEECVPAPEPLQQGNKKTVHAFGINVAKAICKQYGCELCLPVFVTKLYQPFPRGMLVENPGASAGTPSAPTHVPISFLSVVDNDLHPISNVVDGTGGGGGASLEGSPRKKRQV